MATDALGDATLPENSGSYEIIYGSPDDTDEDDDFKPIASAKDGGVVKFFGQSHDGTQRRWCDIEDYRRLHLSLDEDVISGDLNTQPAMALNVSVPQGVDAAVQLQLIYYETSGFEYIEGNDPCFADPDDTADDPATTDVDEMQRAMVQATCTSKEIDDEASFVLYAESDEDAADDKRHLALVETGRFTGVFQGFLSLTDADGDGGGENWGIAKSNGAYSDGEDNVDRTNPSTAVLGVGSGPVSIIYKDTDGKNRRYDIEIDIDPPTVQVDSPAHEGRSDDEKPSFIGSFNDSDSGLAADSFQLDVDNRDDGGDTFAGDEFEPSALVTGKDGAEFGYEVRRRLDYTGYNQPDHRCSVSSVTTST